VTTAPKQQMRSFNKETTEVEVLGLRELAATDIVLTPKVLSFANDQLRLEFIDTAMPTAQYWKRLGKVVSDLHKIEKPFFGWKQNGFIGGSPQINKQEKTWPMFFMKHRLMYQLKLLKQKPFYRNEFGDLFTKVEKTIVQSLKQVEERPCLLHGDLWNGNVLCNKAQEPVFIDPAVYYGHRETDLAMMKLFGGFDDLTFQAYQNEYPLQPGWEMREKIYQLYHVINHANLFGSSYMLQAFQILRHFEN
jgi:protein-ribulosamine 3-kinase